MRDPNKMPVEKDTFITIRITNDAEIKKLNKKFRKKDYATDVLSFNLDEKLEDGSFHLGDIVVNRDQAKRQAKDYGNTPEEEISELSAHGILHLLGVHHDGDDH